MKRQLAAVMILMLVFAFPVCGCAEAPAPTWYELNAEQTVLTLTLPANPSTGYAWEYTVSDEEPLALVKEEYIPDENSEKLIGSGGTWVASFVGKKPGDVELTLNYKRSWEAEAAETRSAAVHVAEDNRLTVLSSSIIPPK